MPTPTPHIDAQFKTLVAQDISILDKFLANIAASQTVTMAKYNAISKFRTTAHDIEKTAYATSGGA